MEVISSVLDAIRPPHKKKNLNHIWDNNQAWITVFPVCGNTPTNKKTKNKKMNRVHLNCTSESHKYISAACSLTGYLLKTLSVLQSRGETEQLHQICKEVI